MIELLTPQEMAQADRLAITAGVAGLTLMEAAGRAVAMASLATAATRPPDAKIVVVCGPGNNGGDGFVAARLLAERGNPVHVMLVGKRSALKGDALEAARRWPGAILAPDPAELAGAGLIIDALFGAGLARPVDGLPRAIIEAINAAGAPVIAVDLPSGIQGATGAVLGAAVKAKQTVTFFRRKPGHLLLPGRLHCGALTVTDIGIPASVLEQIGPRKFVNTPDLWGRDFPIPRIEGHKYARGHAVIVSGGISSTGAARLAARGALRAGAGLVTIASPAEALAVNAAANLAIMVRPVDGARELAAFLDDRRLNAVVLGPGGGVGASMREQVRAALNCDRAVVLDADALTSFDEDPQSLAEAISGRHNAATVLTPHEGEFARLFKSFAGLLDLPSKLEKAVAAAEGMSAVVLLKGADSVVAAPDGRAAIADNAQPWLATAGSGDVLAGMIAGLLAQGMPPFESTAAAVWLHGETGSQVGPGLISEDIPEVLPDVMRKLFASLERPLNL